MAAEAKFEVGDVIRMKKPHPCGGSEMRTPGNGTAQTG